MPLMHDFLEKMTVTITKTCTSHAAVQKAEHELTWRTLSGRRSFRASRQTLRSSGASFLALWEG